MRRSSCREQYLFKRLHEVGVRSVHGLPGDYNLVALDYIKPAGLSWVGNCNELNAGESCAAPPPLLPSTRAEAPEPL
jgi:TPP-dependent 2-oxoacid decarboxylase